MNNSKPTYPELLKAFVFSCKVNPNEEQKKYISEVIASLMNSEDWEKETNSEFKEKKSLA